MSDRICVAYFGDASDPGHSCGRELADEARRVVRTRVVNPKWVQPLQRHGYKGAFEMAAVMDCTENQVVVEMSGLWYDSGPEAW